MVTKYKKKDIYTQIEAVLDRKILKFQAAMGNEQQEVRDLKTIIALVSIFNPYLKNTTLMKNFPEETEDFCDEVLELLQNPNPYFVNEEYFNAITNEQVNYLLRIAILTYIQKYKNAFELWGELNPEHPLSNEDQQLLSQQVDNLLSKMVIHKQNLDSQTIILRRKKISKQASVFAGTALIAVGITALVTGGIAAAMFSGGMALIAIGAISVVAYMYYRHKAIKNHKKLNLFFEESDKYYSKENSAQIRKGFAEIAFGRNSNFQATDPQFQMGYEKETIQESFASRVVEKYLPNMIKT